MACVLRIGGFGESGHEETKSRKMKIKIKYYFVMLI